MNVAASKQQLTAEAQPESQKRQLIAEVQLENQKRKCSATFRSLIGYLWADHSKNTRAAKIGILTVFLLVAVLTTFKSILETLPLFFVKMGQEQVGAIDYIMLNAVANDTVTGDVNPYAVDWINDPFAVDASSTTTDPSAKCLPWQPDGIIDIDTTKIRVCDDHIVIDEQVSIFRVNYFEEHLSQLEGF